MIGSFPPALGRALGVLPAPRGSRRGPGENAREGPDARRGDTLRVRRRLEGRRTAGYGRSAAVPTGGTSARAASGHRWVSRSRTSTSWSPEIRGSAVTS
ncbi:hypothetical protein GCM10010405_31870 [Streptomyces macrosporus]|uniref:Uncharacterized protein n=1 Tax=Streptomyces macrosporus TaxID=44032 RepID=A0ABN3K3Y9_9ACTN